MVQSVIDLFLDRLVNLPLVLCEHGFSNDRGDLIHVALKNKRYWFLIKNEKMRKHQMAATTSDRQQPNGKQVLRTRINESFD